MKKILLTLAAIVLAVAANAQFVVGGNISYRNSSMSTKIDGEKFYGTATGEQARSNSFGLNLTLGYQLNEKMEAGVIVGYSASSTKQLFANSALDLYSNSNGYYQKVTNSSFNFGAYFRYGLLSFDRVSIFAEAKVAYSISNPDKTKSYTALGDSEVESGVKSTNFAIAVYPGIAYKVNEHLSFDLLLNGCNLGYSASSSTSSTLITGSDYKVTTSGFGIAVGNTTLSLGMRYRF